MLSISKFLEWLDADRLVLSNQDFQPPDLAALLLKKTQPAENDSV